MNQLIWFLVHLESMSLGKSSSLSLLIQKTGSTCPEWIKKKKKKEFMYHLVVTCYKGVIAFTAFFGSFAMHSLRVLFTEDCTQHSALIKCMILSSLGTFFVGIVLIQIKKETLI